MSKDSTDNVVQIFGYFQDKRFTKALEHLAYAYKANLDVEAGILRAIDQIGWDEDNMTPLEKWLCEVLTGRAAIHKHSGERIKRIMRCVYLESYDEESSEDSDDPAV